MQAPNNEKRPQAEEPAGVECAVMGGVHPNSGAAAMAIAGAVSERARSDAVEVR